MWSPCLSDDGDNTARRRIERAERTPLLGKRSDSMSREEWWVNARALRKPGMGYEDTGSALGMEWRTAKQLCSSEEMPRFEERKGPSKLGDFKPLVYAWLDMRPKHEASLITSRIRGLGYDGSYTNVRATSGGLTADGQPGGGALRDRARLPAPGGSRKSYGRRSSPAGAKSCSLSSCWDSRD